MNYAEEIAATRGLETVDLEDRPIGGDSHGEPGLRASHVFLLDDHDRVLLQVTGQRHRNPSRFGSSTAGFVLRGERYRDAALRRLAEEIGVHPKLEYIGRIKSPERDTFKFSSVFVGRHTGQIRPLLPEHVAGVYWYSSEQILDLYREDSTQFTPSFPYTFGLLMVFAGKGLG